MKSIRNHLSLIIALVSILFAIQTLSVTNRAIDAYKEKLKKSYTLVIVSQKKLDIQKLKKEIPLIFDIHEIDIDQTIHKIDSTISGKNLKLLKLSLPKFYKVTLSRYPTPMQIEQLKKRVMKLPGVKRVEDFRASFDVTYKLLTLVVTLVTIFSGVVFIITSLLIVKELRIWQFKHNERMTIMGLFGSPKWLSSAVLFRLAIVDAIIASIIVFILFNIIATSSWLASKFDAIGINVEVFNFLEDFPILLGFALALSLTLAITIVFTHKEEV